MHRDDVVLLGYSGKVKGRCEHVKISDPFWENDNLFPVLMKLVFLHCVIS